MTLLLFGEPSPSLANRFGLRRSQLLFHFGCCSLRTFATETTRKLAPVICVDVGVMLSPRNGYVREAVVDQEFASLAVHVNLPGAGSGALSAAARAGESPERGRPGCRQASGRRLPRPATRE